MRFWASISSLAFLPLLPYFSFVAQTHRNVSLATSLTAQADNSFWALPSGDFAFWFQQIWVLTRHHSSTAECEFDLSKSCVTRHVQHNFTATKLWHWTWFNVFSNTSLTLLMLTLLLPTNNQSINLTNKKIHSEGYPISVAGILKISVSTNRT